VLLTDDPSLVTLPPQASRAVDKVTEIARLSVVDI